MDKPRAGTFRVYLEERQKGGWSKHAPPKVSALGLLEILAQEPNRTSPISELMTKTGMGFTEYSEALKSLETAGLIALTGAGAQQAVKLTSKGEEVALLAQAK